MKNLSIAVIFSISFFIIWFASMIWNRTKGKHQFCDSNSHWDDAPIFPVCQQVCAEDEISDGRGKCVSREIPFTKMKLL